LTSGRAGKGKDGKNRRKALVMRRGKNEPIGKTNNCGKPRGRGGDGKEMNGKLFCLTNVEISGGFWTHRWGKQKSDSNLSESFTRLGEQT